MAKKKKNPKKRKPKGKLVSETIEEKKRASERPEDEAPDAPEPRVKAEELRSEPPPRLNLAGSSPDGSSRDDDDALRSEPAPHLEEDDEDEYEDEDDDDAPSPASRDDDAPPSSTASAPSSTDDDEWEDDEEWDDDDEAAGQMGYQRYVMAGFFGLWLIVAYIFGQALTMLWSNLAAKDWFSTRLPQVAAVPHEGDLVSRASLGLVLGAVLGAAVVMRYYYKPSIRQWADEVAEELQEVKWPTRKEVGNNTIVCIAATTVITLYLSLLDRFWGFLTNLIYAAGT